MIRKQHIKLCITTFFLDVQSDVQSDKNCIFESGMGYIFRNPVFKAGNPEFKVSKLKFKAARNTKSNAGNQECYSLVNIKLLSSCKKVVSSSSCYSLVDIKLLSSCNKAVSLPNCYSLVDIKL